MDYAFLQMKVVVSIFQVRDVNMLRYILNPSYAMKGCMWSTHWLLGSHIELYGGPSTAIIFAAQGL